MNKIDQHIGARVKKRRAEKGLTIEDFAVQLNTTVFKITDYEAGRTRFTAVDLFQLCQILDVKVGYFFEHLFDEK